MLLRLAYLAVTNAFAALRLLPITDHDKDTEILALRHQLTKVAASTVWEILRGHGIPPAPERRHTT